MRSIQEKIPKNLYTKVKLLNMKINYALSYPWIRTEITLRTILSLSIRTVFCIIATTWSNSLLLSKIFFESTVSAFMPPLSVLTMTGTTYTSQTGRHSLIQNASCLYFVNFSVLFAPTLFCCVHAMSLIQIFLSVFNFKITCAFLAIVAYRRCNLKSHASFALSLSNTIPLSHRFSWPANFCCFAQATARIICARLCLVRYSPFASLMFPATTCSTVSEY